MKILQEKNIKAGAGCQNMLRGVARRQHNQLLVETISMATLRSSLKMRGEQIWNCPACEDPYDADKV